ncbi:hypothetical protein [Streptomyces winkii]|uniref:hypothetical protein n=1 Tax=Streptomyces winkii TaxID=3051178 RepID=UPI0028D4F688|nr:hypothetical protein [Streptomyces sp. DSM 40971]
MTTAERGRAAVPWGLVALTLTGAVCAAAALVLASRHLLAACEGAAVPWSHFALAYAGLGAALAALALYVAARVRGSRGADAAPATGRAGLVTAVFAGVVVLAGATAVWSDHNQAAMAYAHTRQNALIACTTG